MILNEMTQNKPAMLAARRTVHRTPTTEPGLPSAPLLTVDKPEPVFKKICVSVEVNSAQVTFLFLSTTLPSAEAAVLRPWKPRLGREQCSRTKGQFTPWRRCPPAASSIWRTRVAAHCLPTAVNHINAQFGIHVSFCWSLHRKKKSFIKVHVVLHLDPVQMKLTPRAHDPHPVRWVSPSFSPRLPSHCQLGSPPVPHHAASPTS